MGECQSLMASYYAADAFLAQLPKRRLTQKEIRILDILMDLSYAVQDFLPKGMSLQEWAVRRVPYDAIHYVNATGVIHIPLDQPMQPKASFERPMSQNHSARKKLNKQSPDEFWASLADDALTDR